MTDQAPITIPTTLHYFGLAQAQSGQPPELATDDTVCLHCGQTFGEIMEASDGHGVSATTESESATCEPPS